MRPGEAHCADPEARQRDVKLAVLLIVNIGQVETGDPFCPIQEWT